MAMLNRVGESKAPCGMPLFGVLVVSEQRSLIPIVAVRFVRNDRMKLYVRTPQFVSIRFSRIV